MQQVHFSLTPGELAQASRIRPLKIAIFAIRFWVMAVFSVPLVLIAFAFIFGIDPFRYISATSTTIMIRDATIFSVLFILYFYLYLIPKASSRVIRDDSYKYREVVFAWDAAEFKNYTENYEFTSDWASVRDYAETKTVFCIYLSDTIYFVLPKRAFTTDAYQAMASAARRRQPHSHVTEVFD